jgi:glycerol-3-phosphate dehydrogenase (NAD(P)+)
VANALNRLIAGELPLDDWVAQVRATVPAPPRFDSGALWRRWWWRLRHRPA